MNKAAVLILIALILFLALINSVFADSDPPIISVNLPTNNTNGYTLDYNFSFIATDSSAILWCRLYGNDTLLQVNSNISNTSTEYFRNVSLGNGTWWWYIECMDNQSNSNTTGLYKLYVRHDRDVPTIEISSNSTVDSDGKGYFTFTPTDKGSGLQSCELILNGTSNRSTTSITNGSAYTFAAVTLEPGDLYWRINCTDKMGNEGQSILWYFNVIVVTDIPSISINSPTNNTVDEDGWVTFQFTPVARNTLVWCGLVLNGSMNETSYNVVNNTINNISAHLKNGTWPWYINCTDIKGTTGNSSLMTLYVDILLLESKYIFVTLNDPDNETVSNKASVTFTYTPRAILNISACDLLTNGSVRATNTSIVKSVANNFTEELSEGTWEWQVRCSDSGNNTYTSGKLTLYIDLPEPTNATQEDLPQISYELPELPEIALNETREEISVTKLAGIIITIVITIGTLLLFLFRPEYVHYVKKLFGLKILDPDRKRELMQYIITHLNKGYSAKYIKEHLIRYKWKEEYINEVFKEIEEKHSTGKKRVTSEKGDEEIVS